MYAGIDDAVRLADQFGVPVTADPAETVVGIGDHAAGVGDADDGMLVEREFLVVQCPPAAFAFLDEGCDLPRQHTEISLARGFAGVQRVDRKQLVQRAAQRVQRLLAGGEFAA